MKATMKGQILRLAAQLLVLSAMSASAEIRYVDLNSASPTPPYTNWTTSATTIQQAVDAAVAGDQILVTNGVYQAGGRAVFGAMINRVAVTKAVTVQSVNGAAVTVIRGHQVAGTTNGNSAVRCVYLTNGAALVGFTLTYGATRSSGDYSLERSGGGVWCESTSAVISNCVLTGNAAAGSGGGVYQGTLANCTLTGNAAYDSGGTGCDGGGAAWSTLANCTLTGNAAGHGGGGANYSTLNNCTLTDNSAFYYGGGAYDSTLNNCIFSGNSAIYGGGANNSPLNNCTLSGNSATYGGGAYGGSLNNCTLFGNSAGNAGGGAFYCGLRNCIVYHNTAPSDANYSVYPYDSAPLNYCCTTPLPDSGTGNFTAEPQLVSLSHLSANSPCIGAGNAAYAAGLDIDGEAWANPPSIGCDEVHLGALIGPLSLAIQANYTNVATGFAVSFMAEIGGHASANRWDFGDGTVVSNQPFASHSWSVPGDYDIVLRAYNDTYPTGISASVTVHVRPLSVAIQASYTNVTPGFAVNFTAQIDGHASANRWDFGDGTVVSNQPYAAHSWSALGDYPVVLWAYDESYPNGVSATVTVHVVPPPVHYVALGSTNPVPPYTSWATAATNIQHAVDAATVPGALVLVTNGTYAIGGRAVYGTMTNRVAVDKPVIVRSVNGPTFTVIQGRQVPGTTNGNGAIRCVYLASGASLSGFTLTKGATRTAGDPDREQAGGGLWCESTTAMISNSVVTGNSALYGVGTYFGTLNNCVVSSNAATYYGGGAYFSTLNNCTLNGNSADYGGGAYYSSLDNCTLSGNAAPHGGGAYSGVLNNCALTGNTASYGGGVHSGTLNNCTLTGNLAGHRGGGTYFCTLRNCTLTANSATEYGGGACGGTLNNCALTGNSAASGGGADGSTLGGSTLNNCTLSGNSAASGGGAFGGTLNNCAFTGNSATNTGGGASGGTLNNCSLISNSAGNNGGGEYGGTLRNCLVYYNTAPSGANYSGGSMNYCCTMPFPVTGTGNITSEPQLTDFSHLSAGSPCRGAGSAAYATGLDIDEEAWTDPPSIGCDEYHPGAVTGPLSIAITASYTNVATGFAVNFTSQIGGHASANRWDFGDGTVVSNPLYASHSWVVAGDYSVAFQVYNDTYPAGISATVTVHVVDQPVHYVAVGSSNPVAPYSSWAAAAANIQDAVDAAYAGGSVLVTNGVYDTGGRAMFGTMTNRVAVNRPVTVQSINGPVVTLIRGFQVPGTSNGSNAVRCVYLTNGAALVGFTLTNGATRGSGDVNRERSGGGVWCESTSAVVSNCVLAGNSANYHGGGAYQGSLNNCTLSGNTAYLGGGVDSSALNNCTLSGNSATTGGGAYQGTLNNCTLASNSASYGGGVQYSTLSNCTLIANSATHGGGARDTTLNNCALTGNSATYGGGAGDSTLNNCTLTGNSALADSNGDGGYGGGADGGTLNNCTLSGNSAGNIGGGASGGNLRNCIVYYNTAPSEANYSGGSLNYCCTTPLPGSGTGNLSAEPQLADLSHLSVGSPCRGAGSATYATGMDVDGEAWASPPSIGCDEYHPGAVTGPLNVAIQATYTTVTPGFTVNFTAVIGGRVSASRWDFGNGTIVSNQPYASHTWAAVGDYPVVLWAYNESYPNGVSANVTVHVVIPPVHYVALVSTNPVSPYMSWATAATNIQHAVDAATVPGARVLVTNGVYDIGGQAAAGAMNRVAVDKPLVVESVNGPEFTFFNGSAEVRCAYLTQGATLSGFTLTNGLAAQGGGVFCESASAVVSNCVLSGNQTFTVGYGGGAYNGTLNNCTLTGNSVRGYYDGWGGGGGGRGGGAFAATLNNCILTNNSAELDGGGAYQGTLNNCSLIGNSATYGGGADGGTLNNCTLTSNSADLGGGARGATLTNCTLTGNSAYEGGGAADGTLSDCTLSGNSAQYGGGANGGTLANCTLTGNSALADPDGNGGYGGGTIYTALNNCMLMGNAADWGAGASSGTLNNCTLSGNSAGYAGGGVSDCSLINCIVYYNTAPSEANYTGGGMSYCCTTPLPVGGTGNISVDPQLASPSHLSALSPCIGKGNYAIASGVDIDGELWADPPSIGCDEYHAGAVTGPISVSIAATFTNVAVGYPVGLTALIEGRTALSVWVFGDGSLELNQPYVVHTWTAPGEYPVALWCFNDSHPEGVSATLVVRVASEPVHYVAPTSSNPVSPYTSWTTAATNIQDAVDAAYAGGTVLVSNGVYQTGGRAAYGTMTNRVAVTKPLTVQSLNGPGLTVIDGTAAVRCVLLAQVASLTGFTLTNGTADWGGGVWCQSTSVVVSNCVLAGNSAGNGGGAYSGTLHNCTLIGNSAPGNGQGGGARDSLLNNCTLTGNSGFSGGGAYSGTLNNCTLTGNSTINSGGGAAGASLNNCTLTGNSTIGAGGGAWSSTLNNCTLTGNSASYGGGAMYSTLNNCTLTGNSATNSGGGAHRSTLNNCTVYFNTAAISANYLQDQFGGGLNYCCTTPMPTNGVGNFTNAPLFADEGGGNLRLQSNSPCINSGFNGYAPAGPDLDGNPRIVGSTVDIGAYECQLPALLDYYHWLQNYGLPTSSSAVYTDADNDGMNNWQEWIAGTVPTNALSQLRLLPPIFTPPSLRLRWNSDTNHAYVVERITSLKPPVTFSLLRTNVPGLPGTTTFIDTTAASTGAGFYRIGTDSTNGAPPLRLQTPMFVPASVVVSWTSVTNRSYVLERSTILATPMLFTLLATNLVGQPGTTSYTDTNAVGHGPFFYRVGVQQ